MSVEYFPLIPPQQFGREKEKGNMPPRLHPLLTPNSHGHGASVHMDVASTRRPPPLIPALTYLAVLRLLPRYLLDPGFPRRMPVNTVSLVRSTPLCRPQPAPRSLSVPRGFPLRGSLPPFDFSHCSHVCPPPFRP